MTHISYNARAADRMTRANMIDQASTKALEQNEARYTDAAMWAGYVFVFFCVTGAAVFAVACTL